MSETKWTPGPWEADYLDRNEQRTVTGGNGRLVSVCAHECIAGLVPEMEANACLIAAAPDLYRALAAFMRLGTMDNQEAIDAARRALAKAKGETP